MRFDAEGQLRPTAVGLERPVNFFAGPALICSAMRVCQPGPVAFHRSMTSTGSLIESSFRGFSDAGRPPRLTSARASISSFSSGSSSYSPFFTTCASTRARSDCKERRDTGLFAFIDFPHAEYVTFRATRRVSDDYHPPGQYAVANNSLFAVLLPNVLNLKGDALKNQLGIREVQTSFCQSLFALDRIEGDTHRVNVATKTSVHNPMRVKFNE
jgi:hypothetical protein